MFPIYRGKIGNNFITSKFPGIFFLSLHVLCQIPCFCLGNIFAVGLNMAIGSYEQKYGEIKVRKAKRGNASEVFGMED